MLAWMKRRGRPPYPDILTPREWEVLGLVESGYSNEEIASRLGISLGGAKFHVSEILGKLHLSNREEAARWHRQRLAPVPIWVVLRDWLWSSPLRAAETVGASVGAVALAGVAVLAIAVARGDTNEGTVGGSTEATTVARSAPADSTLVALAPGTHSAPNFWPPLTFSVPDVTIAELFRHVSWLTERASEGLVALVPDTAENRARSQAGGYPLTFVNVFRNIAVAAADCQMAAAPGLEPKASDIVGALATRPGLSTSGPVPVTIGGLSGQQVDLSIAPDSTADCPPPDGSPFVPLVYSPGFIFWGAEPGERWRIIVLDVAGLPSGMYATVMIVVYSADAAAWDDHLAASMSLVESFEFDTTPPGP
jgi:DNA-binding CsgD family transcriptional regulator